MRRYLEKISSGGLEGQGEGERARFHPEAPDGNGLGKGVEPKGPIFFRCSLSDESHQFFLAYVLKEKVAKDFLRQAANLGLAQILPMTSQLSFHPFHDSHRFLSFLD